MRHARADFDTAEAECRESRPLTGWDQFCCWVEVFSRACAVQGFYLSSDAPNFVSGDRFGENAGLFASQRHSHGCWTLRTVQVYTCAVFVHRGSAAFSCCVGVGLPHFSSEYQLACSPECNKCIILGVVGLVYSPAKKWRRFGGEDPPPHKHCHSVVICQFPGAKAAVLELHI